jgi:hypothetical protein
MEDDNYTFVVCPPSLPPPSPPPDFGTWSAMVPWWFWLMFTLALIFATGGAVSLAYMIQAIHATRRDMAMLGGTRGRGTTHALSRLEAQVAGMCTGL